MATASPIPENTVATDNTAADLLVLVTAMAPEHFKGVLANLESAFAPEQLCRCHAKRIARGYSLESARRRDAAVKRSMVS